MTGQAMKAVLLLIGFVLASIHFVEAQQQSKPARIGFLAPKRSPSSFYQVFREGLRDLVMWRGKMLFWSSDLARTGPG